MSCSNQATLTVEGMSLPCNLHVNITLKHYANLVENNSVMVIRQKVMAMLMVMVMAMESLTYLSASLCSGNGHCTRDEDVSGFFAAETTAHTFAMYDNTVLGDT